MTRFRSDHRRMTESETLTLTKAWHAVKHLWWVRTGAVGSYGATKLCYELGGHVRFADRFGDSPIRIARFSATPRKNYRRMEFLEWLAMQRNGQFPLRKRLG